MRRSAPFMAVLLADKLMEALRYSPASVEKKVREWVRGGEGVKVL